MRTLERVGKVFVLIGAFALAAFFAVHFGPGGLWKSIDISTPNAQAAKPPYDLTRLEAVNETLKMIRDKYVDPDRVKPKEMLLSALNYVQRDVAQVIVLNEDPNEVTVRVENQEKKFRVDNVQGPWDVSARLREVFGFLQKNLKGTDVDLREVEYAACNGMLHTLDPHSTFMNPEAYKEMQVQTRGVFGGLGIVISMRDDVLTVMNPMPGTPAGRAGLKRFDRIVKINAEATLNMPLDDAVKRLRGDPGTKVTIYVTREGEWQGTRPFELTREEIKVDPVLARQLDNGIGYVRLKVFNELTMKQLDSALTDFKKNGPIKGLVMDLRGNPGGLLKQAEDVADKFLLDGVIVSQVGSEGRESYRAKAPGTEPPYPIVVLISGNSASASEIVAGALKNNDRAIIVGQQSFGKGSVQLIFPDITPDKTALKLTIAQYLTPGDVSIQGVGISPDIELDPMTVDELEMDLTVRKDGIRERDLSAHLSNSRAIPAAKPSETVRYQFSKAEREATRERGGDIEDEFQMDFPIRFGKELAAKAPPATKRLDQLHAVHEFIETTRKEEVAKVAADLSKIGVDWADAPTDATQVATAKDIEVKAETDRADNDVAAGEPMELRVTVKNNGKLPVYRLRGMTESDDPYFDQKELIFGKIAPGQTKTTKAAFGWCDWEGRKAGSTKPRNPNAKRICKIPMDALSRSDGVKVKFEAAGAAPNNVEVRTSIRALERPLFQYSYQIADDRQGNGDGKIQRGEQVTMYLTVKNAGKGRSFDTQANISNLSGDGLFLHAGRFDISNMQPGDVRKVAFTFDVNQALQDNEATISLSVTDRDLREFASEKVKFPIQPPALVAKASGGVKAGGDGALLLASPDAATKPFGRLAPGATATLLGTVGEFDKVEIGQKRFAFVPAKSVSSAGSNGSGAFEDVYAHAPPLLDVKAATMATKGDKVKITAVASDPSKLLDAYIFVGSRKLFYRSNRDSADPKKMSFDFDAPLRPGVNVITVVARENPDTTTRRTLFVRKDAADGSLLKTPKSDDPILDADGGGDDD
jgi:carboxyl-terminal processing protease